MWVNLGIGKVLYNKVIAVCPINDISIGDWADKQTFVLVFDVSATQAQKDAAALVVTNFNVQSESDTLTAAQAVETVDVKAAQADVAINTLRAMTPEQARAWVQANVVNLADAKSLLSTMAAILCVLARRL